MSEIPNEIRYHGGPYNGEIIKSINPFNTKISLRAAGGILVGYYQYNPETEQVEYVSVSEEAQVKRKNNEI